MTKNKKIIGMVHGVFDVLHVGHIKYFKEAKMNCDKLIASVTDDKYVNKSPGKPIFDIQSRIEVLKALKYFDKVVESEENTAITNINKFKPDLYFKGRDYKNLVNKNKNLKEEIKAVKKNNGKVFFTNTKLYSSSNIINNKFLYLDKKTKKFIQKLDLEKLKNKINNFKKINKKILILGDPIIDGHINVNTSGTANKSSNLSTQYIDENYFGGGIILVANFLSNFVKNIQIITSLNKTSLKKVKQFLNQNVKIKNISSNNSLIFKKRFIENYNKQKLFQNTINENKLLSDDICKKIQRLSFNLCKSSDHIFLYDYGYSFSNINFQKVIDKYNSKFFINVQTNSFNYGFNIATKYKKANIMSLDEIEFRLCVRNKFEKIDVLLKKHKKLFKKFKNLIITSGKTGCYILDKGKVTNVPAIIPNLKDTTGCGDIFLAAMAFAKISNNLSLEESCVVAHIAAGLHGSELGNKNIVDLEKLKSISNNILN